MLTKENCVIIAASGGCHDAMSGVQIPHPHNFLLHLPRPPHHGDIRAGGGHTAGHDESGLGEGRGAQAGGLAQASQGHSHSSTDHHPRVDHW